VKGFQKNRMRGFLTGALLTVLLPAGSAAQVVLPPEEPPRRVPVFQLGASYGFPTATFARAERPFVFGPNESVASFGDGFATTGTSLNVGLALPLSHRLDLAFDLIIPRFKMKTEEFRLVSNLNINHATYFGKILNAGLRWSPAEWSWGRSYLMVTGGMYQLINQRTLLGIVRVTKGAFKAGASIGIGVEYNRFILPIDMLLRFHRYTDYGHFVHGDIAWIEASVRFNFPMAEER
jgi:hypothetical protein